MEIGRRKGDGMWVIDVIYLVLIWGIPILIVWRSFGKMGKEERIGLIKEIKHPLSIFGLIPVFVGLLLFLTGSVSASGIKSLQHLGMRLMLFGWLFTWLVSLVKRGESAVKSIVMIVIGVSVFIAYIYLF